MTGLSALWSASLALCVVGSLALAALLLARVIARGRIERREDARGRLLPLLLGTGEIRSPLRGIELRIATDLVCELAELTRGSDLDILLDRAGRMGVPAMLERWLKASSPQKRLTAVETLGLFPRHGIEVAAALDDRNRDVRLGAALILARREDGPGADTLVRKLRIGIDEHSLLIYSLMADLAGRHAEAVAALLFDASVSHEAKVAAADALAANGGRYAPLLALMAQSAIDEPDLQQKVYRALGRTGHPAGAETIMKGLVSPEGAVRAAAAEAAGRASLHQASEALGGLLGDTHWSVRFHAAGALLRLGQPGLAVLHRAACGEDGEAGLAARTMLAEARVA